MTKTARRSRLACAVAAVALTVSPAFAGDPPDDETLFGPVLTAERGERLRLAAQLDPKGWPALRAVARDAAAPGSDDPGELRGMDAAVMTALAKIDATISTLAERLRPEIRRAPLDALESVARAELAMLRAVEPISPGRCSGYLWRDTASVVLLRRAALRPGREVELARLRAIAAARAHKAVNPAYVAELMSEEQAQLRSSGLTTSEIAIVASDARPPGLRSGAICRATIRYLEAILAYPASLKAAVLAYALSGDHGQPTGGGQPAPE